MLWAPCARGSVARAQLHERRHRAKLDDDELRRRERRAVREQALAARQHRRRVRPGVADRVGRVRPRAVDVLEQARENGRRAQPAAARDQQDEAGSDVRGNNNNNNNKRFIYPDR